jgi:hypothetical protein
MIKWGLNPEKNVNRKDMQNFHSDDNYRQNGGRDRTNLSSYPKKFNMDFLVRDENAIWSYKKIL